jgi:hypothetical protein
VHPLRPHSPALEKGTWFFQALHGSWKGACSSPHGRLLETRRRMPHRMVMQAHVCCVLRWAEG